MCVYHFTSPSPGWHRTTDAYEEYKEDKEEMEAKEDQKEEWEEHNGKKNN